MLTQLGFRFGMNGPHAARTIMLDDLRELIANTPPDVSRAAYAQAVVEQNILSKPTRKARQLALRHLVALYGMDTVNPIFRALRRLWPLAEGSQPMIAMAVALARDPLLRGSQAFILGLPVGADVPREAVEKFLDAAHPNRFSPASLKSFAQNISGSWTAAGFLLGKLRKVRCAVHPGPEVVAMLLFLGYLEGRTGQRLFSSEWMTLTGIPQGELVALATAASHRGLLVFMHAGGVQEVRFPGYLTPEEDRIRQELCNVV